MEKLIEYKEMREAIARVRELHYKDGGLCGYCQNLANPDEDSGNWYMVYYPCETIQALDGDQ